MDSYRPGQPPDDGRSEGPRDYSRSRDQRRSEERDRDQEYYRRRGPRHDSHYQNYGRGDGYHDLDRGDRRGRERYDSGQQMNYDDEYDDRGDHDRFNPRRVAGHSNFNYSDVLRYGKEHAPPPNTGEKDKAANDEPSRYLLIQSLKPSVSEELLAKGLEKLYRGADEHDTGATPLSLRVVMIVRERGTDHNMGYAFAEFHTLSDARAAWAKSRLLDQQCTVSSQRFFASFPHSGVFPPSSVHGQYGPTDKEFTFNNPITGREHKYYDERYYTRPYVVNEKAPTPVRDLKPENNSAASNPATGSKRGMDVAGTQQGSKAKKAKKTLEPAPLAELQKWQSKQAELRDDDSAIPEVPAAPEQQTYAVDTAEHQRCYLCNTKFPSPEKLHLHLRKSDTHAAFLRDAVKTAKALERLRKNGLDPAADTLRLPAAPETPDAHPAGAQWRDRAAERRQDGSAAPPPAAGASQPQKMKVSLKGAAAQQQPGNPAGGAMQKGRGMLAKLGWSEGEGLGEDGGGRTAPLEQGFYAAGVGLGHEGSRRGDAVEVAERRTRDERGGFLEATRENARRRFEGL